MPRWEILEFIDGDFIKMPSPSLLVTPIVRQYHTLLLSKYENIAFYPYNEAMEVQLYETFRLYYQKIANQLEIKENHEAEENYRAIISCHTGKEISVINCDRLTSLSRYRFFLCTEPVEHPKTKAVVYGLPLLSKLMGYDYAMEETVPPKHTTGDSELDLMVDADIMFEGRGQWWVENFGAEDLAKAIIQANHRKTPPEKEEEQYKGSSIVATINTAVDHPVFVENKAFITAQLGAMGVELPEGWD